MAKRYGRNQRRAHREQLENAIQTARSISDYHVAKQRQMKREFEEKLKTARIDALKKYLSDKDMDAFLNLLVQELAYHMAPELQKHAETIMRSAFRNDKFDRPLDFHAREVVGRDVNGEKDIVIEARIPETRATVHTFSMPPIMRGRIVE